MHTATPVDMLRDAHGVGPQMGSMVKEIMLMMPPNADPFVLEQPYTEMLTTLLRRASNIIATLDAT